MLLGDQRDGVDQRQQVVDRHVRVHRAGRTGPGEQLAARVGEHAAARAAGERGVTGADAGQQGGGEAARRRHVGAHVTQPDDEGLARLGVGGQPARTAPPTRS
jgi:hypothetical protein